MGCVLNSFCLLNIWFLTNFLTLTRKTRDFSALVQIANDKTVPVPVIHRLCSVPGLTWVPLDFSWAWDIR